MRPIHLYIKDFMCHSHSFIDFTEFNSALIVGKIENNDLYSNGVGKTTIFKAIEYVLFNQAEDINLENIIRDDTQLCQIIFDFAISDQEYRLSRIRTKKGSSELYLWKRKNTQDSIDKIYHDANNNPLTDKEILKFNWTDVSGRRTGDTEKELSKLIKINFKSFRSTIHFVQDDLEGLSTATPEKRKAILKEALDLIIYSKLEKIAKDQASSIIKNRDKNNIIIENLGNPDEDIINLQQQIELSKQNLSKEQKELSLLNTLLEDNNANLNNLVNQHSLLESKFSDLVIRKQNINNDITNIENSINEYNEKKTNILKYAQSISNELSSIKEKQTKLLEIDYSEIDSISEIINSAKEQIAGYNSNIQNNLLKYEELKVPLPKDNTCKHCRQPMTDEHRKICQTKINNELKDCQYNINNLKTKISELNIQISQNQIKLKSISSSKKQLEEIKLQILEKNQDLQNKKSIFEEYKTLLSKFNIDLESKKKELASVQNDLEKSSLTEANLLKIKIKEQQDIILQLNNQKANLNKEIAHLTSSIAVMSHTLEQANKNKDKKIELIKTIEDLDQQYAIYPYVLQAFSTTGIPNLIIQNVLDDLQIECNNLLSQLKPGLQLSFIVEKTKSDGEQDDTLDIKYLVNGKDRYYGQLSGAMKLAVRFSLKLGLAFLLQKMIGADIKLLLLDEVDQALDKASVDAFSDIVKFFQKDFTILVITHNDRLKDKFDHAVLVEQDINMISTARVVSSW